MAIAAAVCLTLATAGSAQAADDPLLGTAGSFSVLAYSTVTNTGPTVINGDLGLSPGTAAPGFPPGLVNGGVHITDAVAAGALVDTQAAYTNAANQTLDRLTVPVELASTTLVAGLYESTGAGVLQNSGTLTFDGEGVTTGIWVFQSSSTLITSAGSQMVFINGANPCNVFWQVASSATLGTNSTFGGTIMASASIAAQTGAVITGRLLALNGAVTLDSNVITSSGCTPPTTSGPLPEGYVPEDFTTGVVPAAPVPLPLPADVVDADLDGLPDTGGNTEPLMLTAAALLAVGALGIAITRSRTSRRDGRIETGRS